MWLAFLILDCKLVTELLSADKQTGGVTEQSDCDLSWPLTFLALIGGGEAGGEFIEWSEETECFARLWRVFPGSLRDINFRTACGLSVPENQALKKSINKS